MAKKAAAPKKETAPKRQAAGTVGGKNVYDKIGKIGDNAEMGGMVPTRMLGKGVSAK